MSNYQANIITKNPATPTGPVQNGSAPGMWRMDEVAYWVKQGVWPTQGIVPSDPYFPYVTLLLSSTSLSNANNNLFVDSSGAFNPISRNGNTTQGSATPYSTNWSNYFDGTGDYLSVADNAALQFGTGNFTVECWVNSTVTTPTTFNTVIGKWGSGFNTTGDWALRTKFSSNQVTLTLRYSSGWYDIQTGVSINDGAWHHIAAVRDSSTTIKIYVDGTLRVTQTISASDIVGATAPVGIAATAFLTASEGAFTGYVSNARIVKGTAVYTSNFTPPTSALTAISGTSLLTCQSNRFRDASTNNFAVTSNGDTRVTDFSPFSPGSPGITYNQSDVTNWSNYFANTDYLQIAGPATGTGTWTVEGWFYFTSFPGGPIFAQGTADTTSCWFLYLTSSGGLNFYSNGDISSSAGGVVTANTWVHIALVSNASTATTYVNGTSVASGSYAGKVFTGSPFQLNRGYGGATTGNPCYQSNVRMVVGTAVYTSNFTPPTSPLTAISGTALLTCQSAAFTDNSTNKYLITSSGTPTVTGNSPFNTVGYWSNYFDGTGDYLTVPDNAALEPGSSDLTWEMWINTSNSTQYATLYSRTTASFATGMWSLMMNLASSTSGDLGLYVADFSGGSPLLQTTGVNVRDNLWHHIAVVRNGSAWVLYVDGVSRATATWAGTIADISGGPSIARDQFYTRTYLGYISNLRIVKGTAVYTSAFTPPTTPLTAITNTSLLTCQNGRFIDNSTNNFTITVNGNTSVQSFDPFYTATIASNGGSMYFDGSGDYLDGPALAGLGGSGNFTIQAWIYPTTVAGDCCIYETRGGSGWVWFINSTGYLQVYDSSATLQTASTTQLKANQWTHVALVKNGSTCTYYVNGVSAGTFTLATFQSATRVRIGARNDAAATYFGWISGLKTDGSALTISLPSAPQNPSANTTLLVNGMNAGIYDATAINDMETVGNAQVSTVQSKFGGSSVYFDGTGDYLTSNAANDLYAFGTGNFTVEMWFNLSSFANLQVLYDSRPTSTDGLYVCIFVPAGGASVNLQVSAATQITGTATLSTGVWYHLALSRSSGSTRMFLNGTQIGSTYADTNAYLNSGTTRPFIGGSSYSAGTLTVNGYIDEVRVTKGIARYTTNFTPPTQAFPTY